jgi:hypothetical protein
VKRAYDRRVRVAGVDVEGAVADVDGDDAAAAAGWSGSEGEALEGLNDDSHRLLERRVAQGASEFPASPGSLFLGRGHGPLSVGGPEERDEASDKEADLRVLAEQRVPEPVALGRPAPSRGNAWLLLEDARFEELFQVVAHGRLVDSEKAGELGNLAWRFLECLHDGEAVGVPEQAVALGPDTPRNASVHD